MHALVCCLQRSMQYGALGFIVGHELTHSFDNNKDGRMRMWRIERAVQVFKEGVQCFIEQYYNYEIFKLNDRAKLLDMRGNSFIAPSVTSMLNYMYICRLMAISL